MLGGLAVMAAVTMFGTAALAAIMLVRTLFEAIFKNDEQIPPKG